MDSSGEPQTKRLRILALHGAKANNETTRIQLENLQISEDKYDLVYLRGVVEDAEGHEDLADLVNGPFYSWIDDTSDESRVQSIHRSVLNVYHVIRDMGPFDGIFAFSSGAVIATIVMNMLHDETLREKFLGSDYVHMNSTEGIVSHSKAVQPSRRLSMDWLLRPASNRQDPQPLSPAQIDQPSSFPSAFKRASMDLVANARALFQQNEAFVTPTRFEIMKKAQSRRRLMSQRNLRFSERMLGSKALRRSSIDYLVKKTDRKGSSLTSNTVDTSPASQEALDLREEEESHIEMHDVRMETSPRQDHRIKREVFVDHDVEAAESQSYHPKFIICAYTASSMKSLSNTRRVLECGYNFTKGSINGIKSFHLIGIADQAKAQTEEWAMTYADRSLLYIQSGHAVPRNVLNDTFLLQKISTFIDHEGCSLSTPIMPTFVPTSCVSSISVLPEMQVSLVRLNENNLPGRQHSFVDNDQPGDSIVDVLKTQPRDKPFLFNARTNFQNCTTYGEVYDFIRLGDGNLSKLGIEKDDVVVYVCPLGAVGAIAFLSFASSSIASPLAPNTKKEDCLEALEQLHPRHLMLFTDIECAEIKEAFEIYSNNQVDCALHKWKIVAEKPGLFQYEGRQTTMESPQSAAFSSKTEGLLKRTIARRRSSVSCCGNNNTCLLLRTSGTTSTPKVVPLKQSDLVRNAAILASSLGLRSNDICYNVMPLFHIGGLSASVLSTLVSGGTLCCETMTFNPQKMFEAIATSSPRPTWYSAVPTISNSVVKFIKNIRNNDKEYENFALAENGVWPVGQKSHALRFIRSGAAELLDADAKEMSRTFGGIPIVSTYSMSEQMPITQPPNLSEEASTSNIRSGTVGVAVSASLAIVDGSLRPLPPNEVGEIAISGPTIMKNYLGNPEADMKSYFYLDLDVIGTPNETMGKYFLTGDTAVMDKDGFITLKGRSKEVIKKGGEQISPFQVEEILQQHNWVEKAVCFGVPSSLYGEVVGAAIILAHDCPPTTTEAELSSEMQRWMISLNFDKLKWPMKYKIVLDKDLPKTNTKKYIRVGLSKHLGLSDELEIVSSADLSKVERKAVIDYDVLSGLRFVLACYVMFMHIGSKKAMGSFGNLRAFPWHEHTFFTLAGYTMVSFMGQKIEKKLKYILARIVSMYPLYFVAVLFGLANLLVVCRPSTFKENFTWHSKPDDLFLDTTQEQKAELFCEGTAVFPTSYWASLTSTLIIHFLGLMVTPFFMVHWWLGFYLWFVSIYNQCVMCYPLIYNKLFDLRGKQKRLLEVLCLLVSSTTVIVSAAFIIFKDFDGFKEDIENSEREGSLQNILILGFYLFSPFWILYFVIGMVLRFIYDAFRPAESHRARLYGFIADCCTLLLLGLSVVQVCQGTSGEFFFRPSEANSYDDVAIINRLWDNCYGRLMCPITTLWIYCLSVGEGITARVLRCRILVDFLSPTSYGCYLFHQEVSQWYYAATRQGTFWNWWNYRKTFYWFSPKALPVKAYEFPIVVALTVIFTKFISKFVEPKLSGIFTGILSRYGTSKSSDNEVEDCRSTTIVFTVIKLLTGIEPDMNNTVNECGLASVGMPVVVSLLNKHLKLEEESYSVDVIEMVQARTVGDMIDVMKVAKNRSEQMGF